MSSLEKVVIFGTGSIGEVVYWYLTKNGHYEVVGFAADREYVNRKELFRLPTIPFEEVEKVYPPTEYKMLIAVSYRDMNKIRAQKFWEAKKKGYQFITYVDARAIVWDNVKIGENCFIFEANVIQPFVKIGNDVIIWSGNHIGHHTTIGDHCFIASHAVVCGHVTIDPYCFIGVNSTIREGVRVAKGSLIGAGALIVKDTEEGGVYGGHPATLLRKLSNDELRDLT